MPLETHGEDEPTTPAADRRLRVITDALPVGIAYVDQEKIYRFANQRFAAAYGLTSDEIVGKHADDFIGHDAMELGDPFFEAAHLGQAVDFTHPARHADGRILTVRTFLRPDIDAGGAVHGFYVCSVNVTQQRAAEAALLQSQKMDAVGQLASGIAHDFNNLLAIVLGNLLPLRDDPAAAALLEDYVEPAIRASEQGARLTAQLLAIARRQPLRPEPLDMEACVADFLKLLRRTLPTGIELSLDCRGKPIPGYVDRVQFETALLNLCLNARDAMPGGGRIRIEIDYPPPGPKGQVVRIEVADTGFGMEPAVAAQVFEPFFTTKPAGKGTGLGLSMVWGFARQSAGTIRVETQPGAGTRFILDLPTRVATAPRRRPARAAQGGRGMVLVVDDNNELRRTLCRQLARFGYSVLDAGSGEEALELVRSVPDLRALVTDLVMPAYSGFRLAREALRLRPDLRVVLMSGFDGAPEADREGIDLPTLGKPFAPQDLVRAIEAAPPMIDYARPGMGRMKDVDAAPDGSRSRG